MFNIDSLTVCVYDLNRKSTPEILSWVNDPREAATTSCVLTRVFTRERHFLDTIIFFPRRQLDFLPALLRFVLSTTQPRHQHSSLPLSIIPDLQRETGRRFAGTGVPTALAGASQRREYGGEAPSNTRTQTHIVGLCSTHQILRIIETHEPRKTFFKPPTSICRGAGARGGSEKRGKNA